MALNIKDAETDRVARWLAALIGERLTREMRRRGKSVDWARLRLADSRAADPLLDYDEAGLPR